LKIKHQNQ